MKFRLFSDIHQNYLAYYKQPYWQPPKKQDDFDTVAIIAGDYWNFESQRCPSRLFADLSAQFKDVIYVMGNHEHYGCCVEDVVYSAMIAVEDFDNIHVLENRSIWLEGVAIFGATLWTDVDNENPMTMNSLQRGMADFSEIKMYDVHNEKFHPKLNPVKKHFRPEDSVKLHKQSILELKEFLDIQRQLDNLHKSIVVTHHAPSRRSIHTRFLGSGMNGGWASDLDELIELTGPAYFLHGHMHDKFDYMIGDTRVICNPRGYIGETGNNGFDPHFSFEL